MPDGPVLLFDGVCNLCNGAVHFVLDHERDPVLSFAPLQSEAGQKLLAEAVGETAARAIAAGARGDGEPDTMVLVEDGQAYLRSSGALRVARYLRAPWRWLGRLGWVVPAPLRDAVYRFVAHRRYRWFGRSEVCRVPTPALKARFLA